MKNLKLFINISVLLLVFTGCYFAFTSSAQSEKTSASTTKEKYSQVRIFIKNTNDMTRLINAGLFLDHSVSKPGEYSDAWISETELKSVKASGVPYQILVDDWAEHYKNQPKMTEAEKTQALINSKVQSSVSHSIYGSMGGYLTYNEMVNKLDSMRLQYPNLVSAKFTLGATYEKRQQWTIRLTKNPDALTGRPETWCYGMIHAREPMAMEHLIYYAYWLLENYNIDPLATYILNNREIYLTPIFNPDGYEYNHTTDPNGGGMWRANRDVGENDCFATDLNRNWGTEQYWNSSNNGSSTFECSGGQGTYRGPVPFSEIETSNAQLFIAERNIKTFFGAHTYGNYFVTPWAWQDPTPTPDDAKYKEYTSDMSELNHYVAGPPTATVNYFVRGSAGDYLYTNPDHPGHPIIAMDPETGLTSFWPTQAEIIPLAQEMLMPDQYISLVAGAYVYNLGNTFNQDYYSPGGSGSLKVKFKNKGLAAASNVRIEIAPIENSLVTIPVSSYTRSSMTAFSNPDSVTFNFTVAGTAANNYAIPVRVKIKQDDTATVYSKDMYILTGSGNSVFLDSAENGFSNWTTNGQWGIVTSQSHSPTHSFTDSPTGNSPEVTTNAMTLNMPVNASSNPIFFLEFWHKYATYPKYDFCEVEVSKDNGTSWQTVKSYTGPLSTWTKQVLDITGYAGSSANVKVRFRMQVLFGGYDGWYVDDIKIRSYAGVPSGITYNGTVIAEKFSISQNYPNPFNPRTRINYDLAANTFVKIKIYDMLGKEVKVLVDGAQTAGQYVIDFNAASLSSGVYYYNISTPQFTETKKMMLVK